MGRIRETSIDLQDPVDLPRDWIKEETRPTAMATATEIPPIETEDAFRIQADDERKLHHPALTPFRRDKGPK